MFIKQLSFLVSACLEVRQQNCNLHSFNFSANGTEVSDESGIALASILSMNSALQKFSFEACKTEISDSTGTAIAGSLCSNSSLRSFSFVANSCNISDETCQAMAESIGSTCLTSVDFVALHVFVSEKTIMCLQNALHRNRGLQFVRFETSQDGSACVTVREVLGKAMHKDQVRCEHKQNLGSAYTSYPCFQVPSLAQCLGRTKQPCRNAKGITWCSIGALRVSQRRQSKRVDYREVEDSLRMVRYEHFRSQTANVANHWRVDNCLSFWGRLLNQLLKQNPVSGSLLSQRVSQIDFRWWFFTCKQEAFA